MRRLLLLLAILTPTIVASPAGAQEPSPAVTLRRGSDAIEADAEGRSAWFQIPVWVQAPDRAFELHVGRSDTNDPITATWQTETGPRSLPSDAVTSWRGYGLERFFDITIRSLRGERLRHRRVSWCPSSYERTRIAPGAEDPRYPQICGGNPFTRYQVWGIERGWASTADLWMGFTLEPGRYRLELRVQKSYREALALGPTLQTFSLKVRRGSGGFEPPRPIGRTIDEHAGTPGGPISTGAERPTPVTTPPDPNTMSDLASLPAWGIQLEQEGGRELLTFSATVWNAGPAPLLVDGFLRDDEPVMDAYQSFVDANGDIVEHRAVGTFEFDDRIGHEHWHFTDFARYQLLLADEALVVRSEKEAFCLAPTDAEDLLVERAQWIPDEVGFSQCGWEQSISIREVLPAGWGDTYVQWLAGQSFDVTDLPDGDYLLEVTANPEGNLFDVTTVNDRALRALTLTHDANGPRSVMVPPYLGPL